MSYYLIRTENALLINPNLTYPPHWDGKTPIICFFECLYVLHAKIGGRHTAFLDDVYNNTKVIINRFARIMASRKILDNNTPDDGRIKIVPKEHFIQWAIDYISQIDCNHLQAKRKIEPNLSKAFIKDFVQYALSNSDHANNRDISYQDGLTALVLNNPNLQTFIMSRFMQMYDEQLSQYLAAKGPPQPGDTELVMRFFLIQQMVADKCGFPLSDEIGTGPITIDTLMQLLDNHGLIIAGGIYGGPAYSNFKEFDTEVGRISMVARKKGSLNWASAISTKSAHSIIVVGASRKGFEGRSQALVFYVDPNDQFQKIRMMSFSNFVKRNGMYFDLDKGLNEPLMKGLIPMVISYLPGGGKHTKNMLEHEVIAGPGNGSTPTGSVGASRKLAVASTVDGVGSANRHPSVVERRAARLDAAGAEREEVENIKLASWCHTYTIISDHAIRNHIGAFGRVDHDSVERAQAVMMDVLSRNLSGPLSEGQQAQLSQYFHDNIHRMRAPSQSCSEKMFSCCRPYYRVGDLDQAEIVGILKGSSPSLHAKEA